MDAVVEAAPPPELRRGTSPAHSHLNLTRELALTQFKLKYTGSVLGYLWSLLKPLMYFGVMYVVFITLLKVGSAQNFAMQLLLGIVIWTFVAETTGTAINSIAGSGHMLRKAYFPRVILVVASTMTALLTFFINITLVILIGAILGQVQMGWYSLAAVPLIVELYALILGLSLLLSSLFVYYRDLGHIWEITLQLLFYGSAVVFPFALLQGRTIERLIAMNPFAQIIEDMRRSLITNSPLVPYDAQVLGIRLFWVPYAIVVVSVILGITVFRRLSPRFAESL
jgi:ABC-2 type transport system permease protein